MSIPTHKINTLPWFLLGSREFHGVITRYKRNPEEIFYEGTRAIPTMERLTFFIRMDIVEAKDKAKQARPSDFINTLLLNIEDFYSRLGYSSDINIGRLESWQHGWEFAGQLFPEGVNNPRHHIYVTGRYLIGYSKRFCGAKLGILHIKVECCRIDQP